MTDEIENAPAAPELTLEQKKALALARARLRLRAKNGPEAAAEPEHGTIFDPIMSGIMGGFADEAGGIVGGVVSALSGEGFDKGYNDFVALARRNQKEYAERNPIVSTVAEVGGAVATLPATGAVNLLRVPAAASKAAPVATRLAKAGERAIKSGVNAAATGGVYGGVYGAGTAEGGLEERLEGGGEGAMTGAALSAGGHAAIPLIKGAGAIVGKPLRSASAALMPEREAAKRVVGASEIDLAKQGGAAAGAKRLDAAHADGVPMTPLDFGETTRALGRSAANTSPEGRAALQSMIDDRFETQVDRVIDTVSKNAPGINSPAKRQALQRAAKAVNRPNYAKAMREGEGGIWHEGLEQLTFADTMQAAIRKAAKTGSDVAATEGVRPPKMPFKVSADGTLTLDPSVKPTLQFWDAVKENLDDVIGEAQRAGRKREASRALDIKHKLVDYLDDAVPSYKKARQGAAGFFDAEDALTAGENFVSSKLKNAEALEALNKMKPVERQLFAEGFATKLIANLREAGDRRSVLNSAFLKSPAARERIQMALGKRAASEVEAMMRIENIMDLGRKQLMGNSTTTRQLAELGLAGAVGGAGAYAMGDPLDPYALLSAGLLYGMRRGGMKINTDISKRVAEMLASEDPKVFKDAIRMVAHNPAMMKALRVGEGRIARILMPAAHEGTLTRAGGTQPAYAEDEE